MSRCREIFSIWASKLTAASRMGSCRRQRRTRGKGLIKVNIQPFDLWWAGDSVAQGISSTRASSFPTQKEKTEWDKITFVSWIAPKSRARKSVTSFVWRMVSSNSSGAVNASSRKTRTAPCRWASRSGVKKRGILRKMMLETLS